MVKTTDVRLHFSTAIPTVRGILATTELRDRWSEPSALDLMTNAALAGHLVRAVTTVGTYLDAPVETADRVLLDAPGYLMSIDGLNEDVTTDLHASIRRRGEETAAGGWETLLERWDEGSAALVDRLVTEPADRIVVVLEGRRMRLDDYLVTRLVEMLVHVDDLCAGLGLDPPPFERETASLVIGCLVEVARRRHGDAAVIVALTRRERDRTQALRVL